MDFLFILKWTSFSIATLLALSFYYIIEIKLTKIYGIIIVLLYAITTSISIYQDEIIRMIASFIYNKANFFYINDAYIPVLLLVFILYLKIDTPAKTELKEISKDDMKDLIDKDIVTTLWVVKR